MAEEVARRRWDHTAMIRATMINLKVKKGSEVRLEDCHPLMKSARPFSELKAKVFKNNGVRAKH